MSAINMENQNGRVSRAGGFEQTKFVALIRKNPFHQFVVGLLEGEENKKESHYYHFTWRSGAEQKDLKREREREKNVAWKCIYNNHNNNDRPGTIFCPSPSSPFFPFSFIRVDRPPIKSIQFTWPLIGAKRGETDSSGTIKRKGKERDRNRVFSNVADDSAARQRPSLHGPSHTAMAQSKRKI